MVDNFVTVEKTFERYAAESRAELYELSNSDLMTSVGSITERKIYVSLRKPGYIEVRVYDLSNFSTDLYCDFNSRIRELKH